MNTKGLGKDVPANIPNPTAVAAEGAGRECVAESGRAQVLSLPRLSHCQCWGHSTVLGGPSSAGLMFLF